ncbi:MAG: serine hydrolase [Clostridia bacterium]|nr:serine hydrolase [Clostridia bacterium]
MLNKVNRLIEALNKDNTGVEAVALWQDGELKLLHRYVPAGPRLIYSHTKSFISTAAGIAIDEGLLTLDTKVCELFPDYASIITDERVNNITLRNFLTMSSGFGGAFLMSANRRKLEGYPDYIAYMLAKELKYDSGERFVYSNADTHLAGCMVQRACKKPLLQYCCEKIFIPLDMGFPAWETAPDGTAFGGSGLYLDITEMLKLGVLYLNKGIYNGKRVVSEKWVEEAGCKQIDTGHEAPWNSGYGYQFWTVGQRENSFRADGAYGQYSIVLPEENAVLAVQSSEQNDVAKFTEMLIEHTILK